MTKFLGLLVLDTRFPRLPGDAGRPDSYAMQVRVQRVEGATPQRVVRQADALLLPPFVEAALELQAAGAAAITTSCGFLVRWQAELQAALQVPVWTSSLLLLPGLRRPGILTVDAEALRDVAACRGVPAAGLARGCHLQRALLDNLATLDASAAEADVRAAATGLLRAHPDITDVVMECTNLPPFAAAVAQATGRPVHSLLTLVHERWKAL